MPMRALPHRDSDSHGGKIDTDVNLMALLSVIHRGQTTYTGVDRGHPSNSKMNAGNIRTYLYRRKRDYKVQHDK